LRWCWRSPAFSARSPYININDPGFCARSRPAWNEVAAERGDASIRHQTALTATSLRCARSSAIADFIATQVAGKFAGTPGLASPAGMAPGDLPSDLPGIKAKLPTTVSGSSGQARGGKELVRVDREGPMGEQNGTG